MNSPKTLAEFTATVNQLCRAECNRLNADPTALFGAEHYDYPECMMKLYFEHGLSPEATIAEMNEESASELAFEAMAS